MFRFNPVFQAAFRALKVAALNFHQHVLGMPAMLFQIQVNNPALQNEQAQERQRMRQYLVDHV